MRCILILVFLFLLLQLSSDAEKTNALRPVVDFMTNTAKLGFQFVPIVGPYINGFIALGKVVSCLSKGILSKSLASCKKLFFENGDEKGEEQRMQILAEIGILNDKMDKMSQKIHDNYKSLKSFTVEHEFYTTFIVPADAQFDFMRGVIKYRTNGSVNLFVEHYKANHPVHSIVDISKRLAYHNVTNPIVMAMEADPLRTKHTFEKWTTCINNLYTTMYISYLFYEGLNGRDVEDSEQVFDKISEAREVLGHFIDNYKIEYWPHAVERVMRETADNNTDKNNLAKARILKQELQKIATEDYFLILVYDSSEGTDEHSFVASENKSISFIISKYTMIHQFRRAGCNMVVYRSRTARDLSSSKREDMMWDADWMADKQCTQGSFMKSTDSHFHGIHHAGFIGLIKSEKNVAIRSVGDFNRSWYTKDDCNMRNIFTGEVMTYGLYAAPI